MSVTSTPFAGLRVAAFESRMAGPMAELIRKHGGVPVEAPSLREIPLSENAEALAFAKDLLDGQFDMVIFLTGVGTRYLVQAIESEIPKERFIKALAKVRVVVRGPKPLAVMREWKVRVDVQVPEPNTWHDILKTLDAQAPVTGLRIAVQEYGLPNPELIQGLEDRGAQVKRIPVYRWALPEDTEPLRRAIREITEGQIGAVLFTSAQQAVHLLQVAAEEGLEDELRQALCERVVVASIGPTTSETLTEQGLPVDVVPEHPKMGHLVAALAAGWSSVKKERASSLRIEPVKSKSDGLQGREASSNRLHDSPFLKACRREPTDVTPIWLMRQAGRYMSEYRQLRAKVPFLDLCKRPELACEVTVTAAERLGVDAAILFADILLILEPLGFSLEFTKGEGPVIHNPIRSHEDVDRIVPLTDPSPLDYVFQAVRQIRSALAPNLPLIGFAGAPFTLACYAIEGGSSRHYDRAKSFMYSDPGAWHALMEHLVDATTLYLNAQAKAGAQALQVFDSWVGTLSVSDHQQFVQPHMRRLFQNLDAEIPVIHFGTDTATLLEAQRDAGGQVIGLDWRVNLAQAWNQLGPQVAVQGNLDPVILLSTRAEIERQADRILREAGGRPGHIFNLGHGILPQTPVDHVLALINFVHNRLGIDSTEVR